MHDACIYMQQAQGHTMQQWAWPCHSPGVARLFGGRQQLMTTCAAAAVKTC